MNLETCGRKQLERKKESEKKNIRAKEKKKLLNAFENASQEQKDAEAAKKRK